MKRRGAYRQLSHRDIQIVAAALGITVEKLCETARRTDR